MMVRLLYKIFMLLLAVESVVCLFEEFAGPFYLRFKGFQKCDSPPLEEQLVKLRATRINRTALALQVHGQLPITLDNDIKMRLNLVSKSTNGHTWNPAFDKTMGFCDFFDTFLKKVSQVAFNQTFICPLPKDKYYFLSYPMPEPLCNPFEVMPVFPYGDYRATAFLYDKQMVVFMCHQLYVEVRPIYEVKGKCKPPGHTHQ